MRKFKNINTNPHKYKWHIIYSYTITIITYMHISLDPTTFGIMLMYFLIPGHLEYLLEYTSNQGNMGLNGVYRDIYIKRNLFYSSPLFVGLSFYLGYPICGIFIFMMFLTSFVHTFNTRKDIIFINTKLA